MCNLASFHVVNMNSSIGMFELLVFWSSNHKLCFQKILICLALIHLQGIAFELVRPLAMISLSWNQMMMFMKRLSKLF
jgi:hypothetical protein